MQKIFLFILIAYPLIVKSQPSILADSINYTVQLGKTPYVKLTVINKAKDNIRFFDTYKIEGTSEFSADINHETLFSENEKGEFTKKNCNYDIDPVSGHHPKTLTDERITFYAFVLSDCFKKPGYYKVRFILEYLSSPDNLEKTTTSNWVNIHVL